MCHTLVCAFIDASRYPGCRQPQLALHTPHYAAMTKVVHHACPCRYGWLLLIVAVSPYAIWVYVYSFLVIYFILPILP